MSTYVYGIVRSTSAPDPSALGGVGDPPGEIRLVRSGDLAAVVSTAPEGLLPKRRDLSAHHDVLMFLGERGAVLPMRFGAVAPDDAEVTSELERGRQRYEELLDRLEGRVEFNVKVSHVEEAALRAVLTEDPELRQANERLVAAGGGSPPDRMAFGEQVAHALEDLERHHADLVTPPLAALAERVVTGPPVGTSLANLSLLVPRERMKEVESEVDGLRRSFGPLMEFQLNGPLPPYSFVDDPDE
ncbi:GvpL/GvpF family gas vesicle protein [Nocardiopsis ganjiahuensis]|uniref:GvpL/GvpF family gas vesicle protein n=1 Tax=Nocardiopsis ganjiahuensis TaxID=239984 RepID=UPI000346C3D2|nr:GvpL/GvpF family gas vesicle protein [Nocardiopsis ganjiahuensis]